MPALPFWMIGRTKYIGWGITILYSDGADFWEEKIIEQEDGNYFYEFKNELRPVKKVLEVIKIKGEDQFDLTVLHTHHGPIVNEFLDRFG